MLRMILTLQVFFALLGTICAITPEHELFSKLRPGFKAVDITSHDGITLEAIFYDPKPKETPNSLQNGKNPVIIFISSWGMNKWEYVMPANEYADKGYTVVSYTARGWWRSGGAIALAGLDDQADISSVIDWTLANSDYADAARVGLSGISYGGGLSLLGAAKDSRVKSIVSMSCWVDMSVSMLGNGETIRSESVKMLQALTVVGNAPDELNEMFDDYFSNSNLDYMYDMTVNSSVVTFLDQLNANNAAVFIANGLGDSLFTPNQFIEGDADPSTPGFFESSLTVASKHLEFAPGDHAGPEMGGLFHLPNAVWQRAMEWNDYYLMQGNPNDSPLKYTATHIDSAGASSTDVPEGTTPLTAVVLTSKDGKTVTGYDSWQEVQGSSATYALSDGEVLKAEEEGHTQRGDSSVLTTLSTGSGADITAGVAYITATIGAIVDKQKPVDMDDVSRTYGAVFMADASPAVTSYKGVPTLNLLVNPHVTTEDATTDVFLVAYLLGVDPSKNEGHMFSSSPWTFKGVPTNTAAGTMLTLPITVSLYDMPEGYQLAVVLATQDSPLYLDQNAPGSTIDILSGSTLTMPIGA